MIVVICSGGPANELCAFDDFRNRADVVWIGADRGAYHLLQYGIVPHEIVGDFDSVSMAEWNRITAVVPNVERYQAEKDETDTDLALYKALTYQPQKIILTGVTGQRLDHYEAALRTVCKLQLKYSNIEFEIKNYRNCLRFLTAGNYSVQANRQYPYLSFFAYGEKVRGMTLRGVKYETTEEEIDMWSSRFTSNEIIDEAHISFQSGICLMVRSAD